LQVLGGSNKCFEDGDPFAAALGIEQEAGKKHIEWEEASLSGVVQVWYLMGCGV